MERKRQKKTVTPMIDALESRVYLSGMSTDDTTMFSYPTITVAQYVETDPTYPWPHSPTVFYD